MRTIADHVLFKAKTGMHCFYVKPDLLKRLPTAKRAICTIGRLEFHCALMKDKDQRHYVYISKEKMKTLGIRAGSLIKPKFRKDTSEINFDVPPEFIEVLRSDEKASEAFSKLTSGGKRSLVYLVQRMKTTEKRIEKALAIAEQIKNGVTSARMIRKV